MVSVDGLLDAHEVAVRARVEELRSLLVEAERALEHAVITQQTLRLVLAGRPEAREAAVDGPSGQGSGSKAESRLVAVRGQGMTEAALPEGYRVVWSAVLASDGGVRAGELSRALGLGSTPATVEGMRSKLKRLTERGWLVQPAPGLFCAV
jgi:hypothetical protein